MKQSPGQGFNAIQDNSFFEQFAFVKSLIFYLLEHLRRDVIRRAHHGVSQLPPVPLPTLRPPLTVHALVSCRFVSCRRGGPSSCRRGEVRGRGLAEVAVELGAVALLQAGAEAEVGELDVSAGVQEEVVWFDVPGGRKKRKRK